MCFCGRIPTFPPGLGHDPFMPIPGGEGGFTGGRSFPFHFPAPFPFPFDPSNGADSDPVTMASMSGGPFDPTSRFGEFGGRGGRGGRIGRGGMRGGRGGSHHHRSSGSGNEQEQPGSDSDEGPEGAQYGMDMRSWRWMGSGMGLDRGRGGMRGGRGRGMWPGFMGGHHGPPTGEGTGGDSPAAQPSEAQPTAAQAVAQPAAAVVPGDNNTNTDGGDTELMAQGEREGSVASSSTMPSVEDEASVEAELASKEKKGAAE